MFRRKKKNNLLTIFSNFEKFFFFFLLAQAVKLKNLQPLLANWSKLANPLLANF